MERANRIKRVPTYVWILGGVVVIGIVLFLFLDSFRFQYYVSKGDKETVKGAQIAEYTKAYEIKKDPILMEKIVQVLKDMENFEDKMPLITPMLAEREVDQLYQQIYESKASAQFDKRNYKSAMELLKRAEKWGYEIKSFENYTDLEAALKPKVAPKPVVKKEEPKEKPKEKPVEKTTVIVVPAGQAKVYPRLNWDSEYFIADSDYRYLSPGELSMYSKGELGYIRNEIFARHGYVFKNVEYRNYFNQKSWYYPDPSFKGDLSRLNEVEKANVELIQQMEK